MVVLCSSMQGGDIIEHTIGKCHVFVFHYARGKHLEDTNAKCHLCTLLVSL